MRIGIDFDNTIARYDGVFARLALALGLVEAVPQGGKQALRDRLRAQPEGELQWQRLQALAYGPKLVEAEPFEGFQAFCQAAAGRGDQLYVVSHKTERAALAPDGPDLRRAAFDWLACHGFLSGEGGLRAERVFFEDTRAAKLARIGGLGVECFVDDLEEVLLEPAFPATVEGLLFDPHGKANGSGLRRFGSWHELAGYLGYAAGRS